jgi:HK97 family phage major capsid protein
MVLIMDKYEENAKAIATLEAGIAELDAARTTEKREFTGAEKRIYADLEKSLDERKQLPAGPTVTVQGPSGQQTTRNVGGNGAYELRSPGQPKDWVSLFGSRGFEWPDKETNFFQAVFSGRHHPGLTLRGMSESVPSDGGFWVPGQTAAKIHAVSLENEIVMPRAFVQPMLSNEIKIPAMAIGSHASSLMGGFTASYVAEAGTITEHNPVARSMELHAKKLVGMLRFTSELAADIPGGEQQIINICGKGLSWYRDRFFLKGSGAGQPLGLLNAGCLVTVAPEAGQGHTIVYENLTKMMGRIFAGSFSNSVWICHQSTIPQLLTLSLAVGMAGSAIPVMSQTDGKFSMLTRPVIFTEKTEPLGTKGDILLVDLSQYVIGLRSEMRFDVSIHPLFTTDELLARLIERHDGQPLWDSALTLADGTTTVSPFVCLGER